MNIEGLLEDWKQARENNPKLTYPKFDFGKNLEGEAMVFHTFVKKEDRLMYVRDVYYIGWKEYFDLETLNVFTNRFIDKCKLVEEKGLFNKEVSIEEIK